MISTLFTGSKLRVGAADLHFVLVVKSAHSRPLWRREELDGLAFQRAVAER